MGKLVEFYKQHRRLFLQNKHQNNSKTEKFRKSALLRFLTFCESQNIYHTFAIYPQTAKDFFTQEIYSLSPESKRKYFLILKEFYKRNRNINLKKEDIFS